MNTKKSIIKRAITDDGSARIFFIDSTAIVRRACEIHHTSKTMTAVLGRALSAASLMGSLLKDRDNTLTLQFKGNGPAGLIVCVSDYMGNVRGYAENPDAELPPNDIGKLDVGGAVGRGTMYVIKDLGLNEPYIGVCPLVSGEIAEDVTEYYASSEQTPTVCALGVRVDQDNMCFAAGGYLLQLMPGAEESIIDKLETNIGMMNSVSQLIAEGKTGDDIIAAVFAGIEYTMFDEFDAEYRCTCEREKYKRALVGLREEDMNELVEAGEDIETNCRFCGTKYVFPLDEILSARAARKAEAAAEAEDESEE
ncbi:MAG: Hsp33 family molecular chaperone HslO [Ruminococcaceae bacterium]|nr:Hsp33 family molecular chaperone HslO [Oscillospiraceae bacterium]